MAVLRWPRGSSTGPTSRTSATTPGTTSCRASSFASNRRASRRSSSKIGRMTAGGQPSSTGWSSGDSASSPLAKPARSQSRSRVASPAGADPASELQAKRRELTMSALIDLYEKEGCVIQQHLQEVGGRCAGEQRDGALRPSMVGLLFHTTAARGRKIRWRVSSPASPARWVRWSSARRSRQRRSREAARHGSGRNARRR